jgi:hypothetical protein|tara:strand:- start:13539 stop:14207 length:669 start_codon:yes stop_codon:yes gene_type:complete
MALTLPHTFTTNTKVESSKNQENVDALKKYINGGIIASDVQTSSAWAEAKHFMKGLYHPIDNEYEMTNGVHKGPAISDMPAFHPGYGGKFLADFSDNPEPVPGCAISFYLEEPADVMFKMSISPRGLPINTAGNADFGLFFNLDGSTDNYSSGNFAKEKDLKVTTGLGNDIPGFYRRRYYQVHTIFPVVSAGYHNIFLEARSNTRAIAMKFFTYSLSAYYRP